MELRKLIKGKEHIILEEDGYGGFVSIETEKLTKKLGELFNEEALKELSERTQISLEGLRNMTFIAFIKADIADKNITGWKRHMKVLRSKGYNV